MILKPILREFSGRWITRNWVGICFRPFWRGLALAISATQGRLAADRQKAAVLDASLRHYLSGSVFWRSCPADRQCLFRRVGRQHQQAAARPRGLLSAPFLVWRTWIADRQRHIGQEELYTGLLVRAVEQLGATREEKKSREISDGEGKTKVETITETVPNTEVRLGAIYALEKLARDYEPLHWPIMEILCAYVRKNAGPPTPCSDEVREAYANSIRTMKSLI